jgi:hypothetical protein
MSDVNKLIEDATNQLAEHAVWLAAEIQKIPADVGMAGGKALLVAQVSQIKLRMVRADKDRGASIVWDYPDELGAYLRAESTPQHLRDTLAGGHFVDTEQPAFSVKRVP